MKKATQKERVLQYMELHGTISALEALSELGCYRLAARIADLKKDGHLISSSMETVKNRYGDAVSIAVYRLEAKNEQ